MPPTPVSREAASRRRFRIGFSVAVALNLVVAFALLLVLRWVVASKDNVIHQHARDLLQVQEVRASWNHSVSGFRAFFLTKEPWFLDRAQQARTDLHKALEDLRLRVPDPRARDLVVDVEREVQEHDAALARAMELAREGRSAADVVREFEEIVAPEGRNVQSAFDALIAHKQRVLQETMEASNRSAREATVLVASLGGASLLLAGGVYVLASRALRHLAEGERQALLFGEHLERRVQERTAELEQTLRELEAFSYTIAHDLRAPLRAMAGFAQLITEEEMPLEERRPLGVRIIEAARRMDRLILDLLDYSRLTRDRLTLEPVRPQALLREVLQGMDRELQERNAQVTVDPGTWPVVRAYPPTLGQALRNLISNAAKFVAPGVQPAIRIHGEPRDGRLRVWVEDNGIGIAREHFRKAFGLFERLYDRYPGTGMGLAIVRRAIERMGGTVGLESEVGRGSRFWIELPIDQPAAG